MAVDTSRLRFGDLIAGGSALLLLIFMFLEWYSVEEEGSDEAVPDELADLISFSAWDSFAFIDILLLLIILATLAIVAVRLLNVQLPPLPVPLGTILLGLGALAVLLILFRLIITPNPEISFLGQTVSAEDGDGEVTRSLGLFLGLLASLGLLAGGFLSAKERGEMMPGVGGPGASTGGPLGGGQPHAGQPVSPGGQTAVPTSAADPGAPAGGATTAAGGAPAAGGSPKADWYPDPEGKARLRYWDGTQWTDQTAD